VISRRKSSRRGFKTKPGKSKQINRRTIGEEKVRKVELIHEILYQLKGVPGR
jgi:hypothetical protein